MTDYLIYACVILLTRLVYLSNDGPLSIRANGLLAVAQLAGVGLLFSVGAASLAAMGVILITALCNHFLEARLDLKNGYRLLPLLLLLLVPDYVRSVAGGLALRDWVIGLAEHLATHLALFDLRGFGVADQMILAVFGGLLLANEANILVRAVFHHCKLEPDSGAGEPADSAIDEKEYNAGRVIGFLERWLMMLVILYAGNISALAFIIAAKGLARMKQMEDKQFAEYMLIGTLVSTLCAVVVGFWLQALVV